MCEIATTRSPNILTVGESLSSPPELFGSVLENKDSLLDSPSSEAPQVFEDSRYSDESVEDDDRSSDEEEGSETTSVDSGVSFGSDSETRSLNIVPKIRIPTTQRDTCKETRGRTEVPAADRPSHVSILAGKYLLLANTQPTTLPGSSPFVSAASKNTQKCIHVETREHYLCKVVSRNSSGLGLLEAYHRLVDVTFDCVTPIHEVIMSPKFFYLIFPMNFGNVHAYLLAKKRLREGEAAHLFRQMVTIVKHCHSKGIILRDLKLGKFVFTDRERLTIKLETLEDAVVLADGADDGLADKHGCPNYVSPEKAEILRSNSKYPGKATDIWGLGVMLYTMLVGRYPFNDSDHSKLFVKIRRGYFTIPDYLTSNIKCLVRCLLRKDPLSRLSCDEILRHPWIVHQSSVDFQRNIPVGVNTSNPVCIPQQGLFGRRRGLEEVDTRDDQVVPTWTPSPKKSKVEVPSF